MEQQPTNEAMLEDLIPARSQSVAYRVAYRIYGRLGGREAEMLANCYRNSLTIADGRELKSIAFPSISTGAYGYPIQEASQIPLQTTKEYLAEGGSQLELIEFVTFVPSDYRVYLRTYQEISQLPPIESSIS